MPSDHEPSPQRVHNVVSGSVGGDAIMAETVNILQSKPIEQPERPRAVARSQKTFVDRVEPMRMLTHWATEGKTDATVVLLSGLSGVGKTEFSRQWVNEVDHLFPDGVFCFDLADYQDNGATALADVLSSILLAYGWSRNEIPRKLGPLVNAYRAFIQPRRVLIVADGVGDAAEVDVLAPAGYGSMLVAISNRMEEFVSDQRYLSLKPLDKESAGILLNELVGPDQVERQKVAVDRLLELCGGIPRVLCQAVAPARRHRGVTLESIVDSVSGSLERGGERDDSLADIVTAKAYESLSPRAAYVHRMLGWHPGGSVSEDAIEYVASGYDSGQYPAFVELLDRHLLEDVEGRYRIHPLVKAHGKRESRKHVDAEKSALQEWVRWYLNSAQQAERAITSQRLRISQPEGVEVRTFASGAEARQWFAVEHHNLLAIQRACADLGWAPQVWHLGEAMWVFYMSDPYPIEWWESTELSVQAAVASGHKEAEARMRCHLGRVLMEREEWEAAAREISHGMSLASDCGHDGLWASAVEFEGRLLSRQQRHREALECYHAAHRVYVAAEDRRGVALEAQFIGQTHHALGELVDAAAWLREAEQGFDDDRDLGKIRIDLATVAHARGELTEALSILNDVVSAFVAATERRYLSEALYRLALVASDLGRDDVVSTCLTRMRDLSEWIPGPRLAKLIAEVDGRQSS